MMTAFLMAAGNGMRLRPITYNIQKCLLPVGGKPMLEWWLDAVRRSNRFDKICVNVHYLKSDVVRWLRQYEFVHGVKIEILDESRKLLGTAGTLRHFGRLYNSDIMLSYTDTFSNAMLKDIGSLVDLWAMRREDTLAGIVSFNPPNDCSGSAISVNAMGKISSFKEKSDEGDISWVGTVFCRQEFLAKISRRDRDLARQVFPRERDFLRVISHVDGYDIGRGVESYEQFRDTFKEQRAFQTV